MSILFLILTVVFILISAVMILIILVQRPQGGGLAGAFGGAGGGSTDTVFGGRVGDALTVMTVVAFAAYLVLAIGLNVVPVKPVAAAPPQTPAITSPSTGDINITPVESAPPTGSVPAGTDAPPVVIPATPPTTSPAAP